MADWPKLDQEERLESLFKEISKDFRKINKAKNPDKLHQHVKDVTNRLKECKGLIKDFEREARVEGMPAAILANRKREMVNQLNAFIEMKKQVAQGQVDKTDLLSGAKVEQEENYDKMTNQQIISAGKAAIEDTNKTLDRAARIVEDTLQVGAQTAEALQDQSQQLNRIVDDLNEIEFTMKTASKVIKDITKGLLTDKCIGFLLFAVTAGVVVIIVLKIVNPNKDKFEAAANQVLNDTGATNLFNDIKTQTTNGINNVFSVPPSSTGTSGRRMMLEALVRFMVAAGHMGEEELS
mmetsp:Transcript_5137/g.11178  ORF Transcript_5137/g.11178 Transcript_5137/m.11178 type:complete len:294 (+) Transcript_5137:264-1145(+)|eukprot:CAMPEP_0202922776 /NCGR_PEP_ID=MMETSP1392-20130828/78095_1 /ASSEMBLY_ACC=CAM_ASM_000868 /TAXON_ID=225041 /ORGANISM="Chlamydomonas chlamydogama, Strain SAG 11-48b" /LENGTH=293 /DNA_ID=CAMNT_0049616421 /DNA_START=264 /DNA_END=1145 /DNA_ORIENTATION=+